MVAPPQPEIFTTPFGVRGVHLRVEVERLLVTAPTASTSPSRRCAELDGRAQHDVLRRDELELLVEEPALCERVADRPLAPVAVAGHAVEEERLVLALERRAGGARVAEIGRRAEARRERHRVTRLVVDQLDLASAEEVLDAARGQPEPGPKPLAAIALPRPVTLARRREGARPEIARRLVQPRLLIPADGHVAGVGLVQRRHRRIPLDLLHRLLPVLRADQDDVADTALLADGRRPSPSRTTGCSCRSRCRAC